MDANYSEFNGALIWDGMGRLPNELPNDMQIRDLVDNMLEPGAPFTPQKRLSAAIIREAISRVADQLPTYPEFPQHLLEMPKAGGMWSRIPCPIVGGRLDKDSLRIGIRPLSFAILISLEQMAAEPVERFFERKQPPSPALILCVAGIAVCALLSYAAFTGAF